MLPAAALRQHVPRQAAVAQGRERMAAGPVWGGGDAGVAVQVVSKRLGHATVSITMDVYAHVLKDHENDAAQRTGGALYVTEGSR